MDKLKNIFTPNTVNDGSQNEPGRESGATTHSGGLTGEGSHLAQAHETPAGTTSGLAGNQTSGVTNTAEGSHLAQANNTPAGTTSGLTGNQTSGVTNTSNTSGHDHLPRDTTVAAGGAGLAEHEHRKHEDGGLGSTTTGRGVQNTQSFGNTHGVGNTRGTGNTQGVGNIQGTEYPSGTGYPSSTGNESRIAENMGQGGYSGTNQGASHFTGPTGSAVQGPHATDTANRLDPAVNTSATTGLEDAHQHSELHGGGAETADKQHHLGRDTAIGGGVGAAAYETNKHHHQHQSQVNDPNTLKSDNTSSSHHYGRDAGLGAGTVGAAGLAEHEHHKHDKDLTQAERDAKKEHKNELKEEKKHQHELEEEKKEHHYGRDAAAATGAAGLAEHEHHKHENAPTGTTSAADSSTKNSSLLPGPAPNTAGPHKKDWMNKLDPRVDANPSSADQYISGARRETSELPHRNVGSEASTDPQGHHLGRDTAVAGGVGAAAYEADKHHRDHEGMQPTTGNSANHPSTTATGPQSSTVGGDTPKDHHYGRDAAVAGGVGGAAYEAEKHHKHDKDLTQAERDAKKEHRHELKEERKHHHDEKEAQKEHHYGRDAAVAGGVGGAAYEADKHHKHDKDLTQAERDAKKEHKHELKEEKKHHHEEKEGKKGGLLGFLHRDKSKKYTPEEEAEFDRQEREHHDSHKGRDAGIATAGAAGAGTLYESDKHHHVGQAADNNKALPTAPGNNGIGTGPGAQNALAGDNTSSGHHYGRDAGLGAGTVGAAGVAEHEHRKHEVGTQNTLAGGNTSSGHHYGHDAGLGAGAGAAGAAGVAEHEHDKHSGPTPLDEKPKGRDLGDMLHGVERNRGVPGSSGFPGTEGFGTGTGGALAASEATTDQTGHPIPSHTGSGLGAGQHRHTDSGYAAGQTGQFDNTTTSGLTQDPEYRKKDTTSGLLGSNNQSEYTDSSTTGVNDGVDGRNRLHKAPPASHPASQGI